MESQFRKFIILVIFSIFSVVVLPAQESTDTVTPKKPGLIKRILKYFDEANEPKPDKAFDFSIIGGPHYSSDTGFGIGIVAAGLYRTNRSDTLSLPSSVSIFADATTNKFFNIGVEGYNILSADRYRLNYKGYFQSFDTKFWGIGYENNIVGDNESRYNYLKSELQIEFLWRAGHSVFIGPLGTFDYIHGHKFEKPELWEGQPMKTFNFGPGLTVRLDSRDHLTNAHSGVYIALDQRFFPRFLGNKMSFSSTELTAASFHRVWKGGVIAWRGNARLTYGDTPWGLLSILGGSNSMRGYYEGRYRDKCSWNICVELRQHVWRRNGAVVWVGAGEVFPKISAMRFKHILPNYGFGYRWEFKDRVNIRLDLGFGRNGCGFIFSINEAF